MLKYRTIYTSPEHSTDDRHIPFGKHETNTQMIMQIIYMRDFFELIF